SSMPRASACVPCDHLLSRAIARALPLPALGLAMLAWAPPTLAGCNDTTPVAGQVVICSSTAPNPQTQPVSANGQAGIEVQVQSGAVLEQAGNTAAISLLGAGGHLLENLGSIRSAGGTTVALGAGSQVHNEGSIDAGN